MWKDLVSEDAATDEKETDFDKEMTKMFYPSQITDQIFLGGHEATRESIVKELKITHILACISGMLINSNDNIKRLRVPMDDRGYSQLENNSFKVSFPWLKQALSKKENKVLIHCSMGVNRSSTLTVGFLMEYLNYNLKKSHNFVLSKRESILIHDKYMSQLREFDLKKFGKYSTKEDELPTTSSVMKQVLQKIRNEKENKNDQ